jgi:ATP-binding cassette, subfamily B, bacterial HlyB/CyaB
MTQTASRTQAFDFLSKTPPFDRLSEDRRRRLLDNVSFLRYRIGQQVLIRTQMPAQVSLIFEGQVRVLGYDDRMKRDTSLRVVGPGEMLGWVSLVRNKACETAIASSETVCITLSAEDFLACLNDEPEFDRAVREHPSLTEVFELAGCELSRRADTSSNLKELCFQMWETAEAIELTPGAIAPRLDAARVWLLSRGHVGELQIGDRVTPAQIPTTLGESIRLIGLKWPAERRAEQIAAANLAGKDDLTGIADDEIIGGDVGGAITPVTPADLTTIETAPEQPPERDILAPPEEYPYVRGSGQIGAPLACYQMLAQHLRLSFRKDAVRKLLQQQVQSKGEVSLYGFGTIAPTLRMNAQLATVPTSSFGRVKAPAIIRWRQSFAVVYRNTPKGATIAIPETGVQTISSAELAQVHPEQVEVLLLQPPNGEQSEKFSIWWFLPSLLKYRKVLIEVFISSFFLQLFGLANPLLTQVIIDKVLGQRSIETLNVLGVFMIGVALFEALLGGLRTYLFVDTTNRIDLSLGSEVIDHLFRLPLSYFDNRRVGDIAGRVNELANIRQFVTGTALTVVLDAIFSVIYIAVMLSYSIQLTFVALVTVPFFTALILFVSPIVRRLLLKRAERYADTQSYLVETLNGMQTVKAQNIELTSRWNWYERYARFMNAGFRTVLTNTAAGSLAGFMNSLSSLLLLWFGAYQVLENNLTLGQLIAFRIISGNVTGALLRFVSVWQNFQEVAMSIERLRDILNSEPESNDADRLNIPLPPVQGHVKFDNVSFRFTPGGPLNVANVSAEFPVGSFVGIVGESGSGKSTTMKLLQRLYPPEAGRIQVDGYDISKVELYSLRRQVGVVLQDTLLFNNTVKANIALNNPEATDDDIIRGAKVAAAHDFIMTLPQGYNTIVGERGASLSGGQRQRIAIARTVLQNPRLLILDEATSALDYNLESLVCQNLVEEFKGRTVFFITHRLPTVQNADIIMMMDMGSVVEQGTHKELMAQKGRYYCLYQQQESQL